MAERQKKWILYRHTSPSGKIYIGITSKKDARLRWGRDGYNYKSSTLFYKAILKYGWDNIKHEVLFTDLSEERAKILEVSLIAHYKGLKKSYNLTDGGQGTVGVKKTQKEKDHLRRLRLGTHPSLEARKKMSMARKGRPGTMLGKKHTQETKLKMSISRSGKNNHNYGKHISEEQKEIFRKAQKTTKPVAKIDPITNQIIDVFPSINYIGKTFKCSASHVSECCRGKIKLFKGYKWKFIDG